MKVCKDAIAIFGLVKEEERLMSSIRKFGQR